MASKRKPTRKHRASGLPRALTVLLAVLLVLTGGVFLGTQVLPDVIANGSEPGQTTVPSADPTTAAASELPTETTVAETTVDPDIKAVLTAVGDIILHQDVIDGGLIKAGDSNSGYDFTPIFQYVAPIFQASDLAMANFEGTLAGPQYSGYPFFCAPDEIADALYSAGIRVAWTANNHTLDRGLDGVIRTASVLREKGFQVIGTRPDTSKPADTVVDVKGIRIGLMAYTFETPGTETVKALNGINMPAAADPLIDSFNPYRDAAYEADITAMLERASALRDEGAEMICLSLHWGNEYETRSCSYQRQLAQRLCDAGIELIIGHHPHVLQEIDVLTSANTGRQTLVYYSIGNFVHNMDYSTHGTNGKAQDAIIARVTIERLDGQVLVTAGEYIPTYVVRIPKVSLSGERQHLVVPVLAALGDPDAYQAEKADLEASLERTEAILSDSKGNNEIPVSEAVR